MLSVQRQTNPVVSMLGHKMAPMIVDDEDGEGGRGVLISPIYDDFEWRR